jgi:septal ring factor EnvC (AmiA/AmiB activator)
MDAIEVKYLSALETTIEAQKNQIQSLKAQLAEAEKVIKSAMRSCSEGCASVRPLRRKCDCVAQEARKYFEKYKETK